MNTDSDTFCPPEAIEIAWRMKWKKYDSEDAGIRALRRKVKGIKKEKAREALTAASGLLEEAIRLLKKHLKEISEVYDKTGEISRKDMESFMPLLEEHFPDYEQETKRTALTTAMVYHMR